MKRNAANVQTTRPVMTRVPPGLKKRLQALSKATKRSEAYLASEAIAEYVSVNEWQVAHIKGSHDELKSASEPSVDHADVARWLASWGTDAELPPPAKQVR
jgi:predicted transcriptional regulator